MKTLKLKELLYSEAPGATTATERPIYLAATTPEGLRAECFIPTDPTLPAYLRVVQIED